MTIDYFKTPNSQPNDNRMTINDGRRPNDPSEIRYAVPNGNFTGQANDGEAK